MGKAEELIKAMESVSTLNDRDIRSALGMADSFARGGNVEIVDARYDERGVALTRDALAAVFIGIIDGIELEASKKARRQAREHLNAPYANDPAILRWREQRHARYPKGIGVE